MNGLIAISRTGGHRRQAIGVVAGLTAIASLLSPAVGRAAPLLYDYDVVVNTTATGDGFGPSSPTITWSGSLSTSWTAAWPVRFTVDRQAQTVNVGEPTPNPDPYSVPSTDLGGRHPFTGKDSWTVQVDDTTNPPPNDYRVSCNATNRPLSESMTQAFGYPRLVKPWGAGPDHPSYVAGEVKLKLMGNSGPGIKHNCVVMPAGQHSRYMVVSLWDTPGIDYRPCPGAGIEIPLDRLGERHFSVTSNRSLSCTATGFTQDQFELGFDYTGHVHYAVTLDRVAPRLVVNTTADTDDVKPGDGACLDAHSKCSLRAAIEEANAGGPSTIEFDIPGGAGVKRIALERALPKLHGGITIDATTQPGHSTFPLVKLDGALGFDGLVLRDRDTIRGLAIAGFDRGVVMEGDGSAVRDGAIGTDESGNGSEANRTGVVVEGSRNVVGRDDEISNNLRDGVRVKGRGNTIEGNLIGVSRDGSKAYGNGTNGVHVTGPNNEIGGSTRAERNVISGNVTGIYVNGEPASGNAVVGDYIGTDSTGGRALGGQEVGVLVAGGAHDNGIGAAGAGNLISGNGAYASELAADVTIARASGNRIEANTIGPSASGGKLGNCDSPCNRKGVLLTRGATGNAVGTPRHGNSISRITGFAALDSSAVAVTGESRRNRIQGNLIGMNAASTGRADTPRGIVLEPRSGHNLIGGPDPGDGNVIAAGEGGTHKKGPESAVIIASNGNAVQRNVIGTDPTGMSEIGNTDFGVLVRGDDNDIGGIGAGNLISGNQAGGIALHGSDTKVQANIIGPNAAGTGRIAQGLASSQSCGICAGNDHRSRIGGRSAGAGNLISANVTGVDLEESTGDEVIGNRIGTTANGKGELGNSTGVGLGNRFGREHFTVVRTTIDRNVIAFNHSVGIEIEGNKSHGNTVSDNSIFDNESTVFHGPHLGIDLGGDGVTHNSPGSPHRGPNRLQSFPVLTEGATTDGLVTVHAKLDSTPNHRFDIQVFSNSACDPSGFGEGERLVNELIDDTNDQGHASFSFHVQAGREITATATNLSSGDTSEFSRCLTVGG